MMRALLTFALACVLVAPAAAVGGKPPGNTCTASPAQFGYPGRTGWHLMATVPAKANVFVIVTGLGAPANEWSNVRWTLRQGPTGVIGDAFLTTLFTSAGTAAVELVDVAADGNYTTIVTCFLTVT